MELPVPVARARQVLVRLEASGVNPIDWRIGDGEFEGRLPHVFPLVLGVDGAGVVEAVGRGVQRFKIGDRVVGRFLFGYVGGGSYAEYAAVHEDAVLTTYPASLGPGCAAALPTAGITALQLSRRLDLAPGSKVLIVGATGGVGMFLIQLAVMKGLRVIATAAPDAHAHLRALGVAALIDYRAQPVVEWLDGHFVNGVDGLVDLVSEAPVFAQHVEHVRAGGIALSTVGAARENELASCWIRGGNFEVNPTTKDLAIVLTAVASGQMKVEVEREVPLAQALIALEASRTGGARGKTVIVM
ncbi:hypothetical protein BWP39_28855 [Paraburkholderia acidicola]|nr:hypothetical protein BWP39_28855 [Paraburkholderia acidicola]